MTNARVYQQGIQVVHDQLPAAVDAARVSQLMLQVVRDRADWVGDFARVYQQSVQVVHGQIPADQSFVRMSQLAIQVVRAVGEASGPGAGARRSVIVIST